MCGWSLNSNTVVGGRRRTWRGGGELEREGGRHIPGDSPPPPLISFSCPSSFLYLCFTHFTRAHSCGNWWHLEVQVPPILGCGTLKLGKYSLSLEFRVDKNSILEYWKRSQDIESISWVYLCSWMKTSSTDNSRNAANILTPGAATFVSYNFVHQVATLVKIENNEMAPLA